MANIALAVDEILVSYDVKSLFTSVPIDEAIVSCERNLRPDNSLSARTTLSTESTPLLHDITNFQFNGQHLIQLKYVAMESPVSFVITDMYMILCRTGPDQTGSTT